VLVRLVVTGSLVTFYKLYRKRQKANTPKQRGLLYMPQKEKKDEVRSRQTDQARDEAPSECESDSARHWEQAAQESVETEASDERPRDDPQPILPRHRVRRKRQDQFSEPMD
jgi:hypothetical protein